MRETGCIDLTAEEMRLVLSGFLMLSFRPLFGHLTAETKDVVSTVTKKLEIAAEALDPNWMPEFYIGMPIPG